MWIKADETYQVNELGEIRNSITNHTVKQTLNCNGYYVFGKNGKTVSSHKFIWESFNGPIPEGMEINHKNEVKTDNRICNLELLSHKENVNYGTRNKRISDKMTNGKLSKPILQYSKNGEFIAEFPSIREVTRTLGFNNGNISSCLTGRLKTACGYIWKYKD